MNDIVFRLSGVVPRRFVALVLISNLTCIGERARAERFRSDLAPVLAPGSAHGMLLSGTLSSAQANIVCTVPKVVTQRLAQSSGDRVPGWVAPGD